MFKIIVLILYYLFLSHTVQSWSRGHKARDQCQGHKKIRGQGQRQPFRGQTLSRPRTGMLEAKAKNQRHKRKCSPKPYKKKDLQKFFSSVLQQKTPSTIFFQAIYKISKIQKKVLYSSRGQCNFRGLEPSRPRPRTSKCVLEDVLEAKDVLEDSTSDTVTCLQDETTI